MKKGESLLLSYAWWDKGRPGALAATGLGAALKEYETEKKKAEHAKALAALEKVEAARLKGIRLCLGPAFADTKAALQRDTALTQAKAFHLGIINKNLNKIDANLTTLKKQIPLAEQFYGEVGNASTDAKRREASKKFNLAAKVVGDNLTSADTKLSDFFQQKKFLTPYPTQWARVIAAKDDLDELKPRASDIRLNASDAG